MIYAYVHRSVHHKWLEEGECTSGLFRHFATNGYWGRIVVVSWHVYSSCM